MDAPSGNREERVALYDAAGRPVGSAPRSVVRRDNLRHAATAAVVRDPYGRIYVHRRTDTKDVYPGLWDFTSGGVVQAGEDPTLGAARELAEELGVGTDRPVRLVPLDEHPPEYRDDVTHYLAFRYRVDDYAGPIVHQPEEVAEGTWMSTDELVQVCTDDPDRFVPDTVALATDLLRGWQRDTEVVDAGWDNAVRIREGRWVDRTPRRREGAPRLRAEIRFAPEVAAAFAPFGIAVPDPIVLADDPLVVRHRLVPGSAATPAVLTADDGARVGGALAALHALDPDAAVRAGLMDAAAARTELRKTLGAFADAILPLLSAHDRSAGQRLLTLASGLVADGSPEQVIHGDLGPDHVLVTDGRVAGVIDWTDARLGDPAVDLAWPLFGAAEPFARALTAAYPVTADLRERALLWHCLGPWHEVLWGLGDGDEEFVAGGLAGVVARLSLLAGE